jgi:hypothetical protein
LKNSLEEFRVPRSSGGTTSWRTHGENSGKGVRRGEREKRLRPLAFGVLPSLGRRSAQVQESTVAVGSAEEEDLDRWFLRPGGAQEKPTEGRVHEPLDLIQKSRQPSDQTRGARGLTLLTPGRSPDSHRDIGVSEIRIHEDKRSGISMVKVPGAIWTICLWIHVAEIEASGVEISAFPWTGDRVSPP